MKGKSRNRWRGAVGVAVAAAALANSGCLAAIIGAGAAAGAGAAYAYYQGNVANTYAAAFEDTRAATRTALSELGMSAIEEKVGKSGATFESRTGDGAAVRIYLDPEAPRVPADGPSTHVVVRVGVLGDQAVSERILQQIGAHLVVRTVPIPQAGIVPTGATAPTPPPPLLAQENR